ncbi:MAG: energy transducer TonB [Ignavibacteriaceae bacterium]|nr:energy transducer TonB [Ignavibacteriaceae bacterium]
MPSLKTPKADLRKLYNRTLKISLIVSLAIIIAAFKFSPYTSLTDTITNPTQEIIKIDEIISTVQKPDIPPPPKAPQIIVASIDDTPDDIILPNIDDIEPVPLPDKPPAQPKIIDDENIFEAVEEMPAPIGGIKAIQEKLHFTEIAKRADIEGTVFIQAVIDKNGNVAEANVLKGLGAGLDDVAMNAVKSTKFVPGKQRGRPVNVKIVIPIKFVLK